MLIIIIGVVLLGLFVFNWVSGDIKLKKIFKNYNVAVFGAKGTGKDLLFQKAIAQARKKPYLSNQFYGFSYNAVSLSELSVAPNSYENVINDKITRLKLKENYEAVDVYLSDLGIYLPSQYDNLLSKKYPSFPIYYALSRQFYNQKIHFNTQALNRVWIKIREQADFYIKCLGVRKHLLFIKINTIIYETYNSADRGLLPMRRGLFNKQQRALWEQYTSTNGLIQKISFYIPRWDIHYDSRYFRKVFYELNDPNGSITECSNQPISSVSDTDKSVDIAKPSDSDVGGQNVITSKEENNNDTRNN